MARILVVDDEPDPRLIMRIALENAGHEVIEASDGEEALVRARESAPALILLDLRMPGLDGWGVLERLRSEGTLNGMGVMIVSAFADDGVGARAVAEGCRGFLAKPFHLADLVRAVETALAA